MTTRTYPELITAAALAAIDTYQNEGKAAADKMVTAKARWIVSPLTGFGLTTLNISAIEDEINDKIEEII